MDSEAGFDSGDGMSGLVIAVDDRLYLAIPWADLRRFRVPQGHLEAIAALVHGDEPVAVTDVRGFADEELPEGVRLLLQGVLADPPDGWERPAVRRLAAWAVLD